MLLETRGNWQICWGQIGEGSTMQKKWRKEPEQSRTKPMRLTGAVPQNWNQSAAGFQLEVELHHKKRRLIGERPLRLGRNTGEFAAISEVPHWSSQKHNRCLLMRISAIGQTILTLVFFYLSWMVVYHFLIDSVGFVHVVSVCDDLT